MNTKYRLILESKISDFIADIEDFPFYVGDKTIKNMANAVEAVFDAMEEAAKLEAENAITE